MSGYDSWKRNTYLPFKEKSGTRKERFNTTSGFTLEPVYGPDHWRSGGDKGRGGGEEYPGEYPFTRGIRPTMYGGRLWTMRQYAGMGDAFESNRRYRYLLDEGQTGLSVAFDLPTQIGLDSDDPLAEGEVGKVGVAVDSVHDIETLFNGIPLEKVTTSMTINSTAAMLLAMYIVVAERRGIPRAALGGTIQNDILKEYIARGTYIFPPGPSLRITTDIFEFCSREMPRWNTISISGYHIREAGANAVQEVAFTLANGITYVEAAVEKGLDIDDFAGRLSFFFNASPNLLEEVAKFRAARRLWARIMKERFGARKARSMQMRFHTQTAGCSLQARQIDLNVVRTTIQALAAVLGGTQSLHTNSKDEALSLPAEESARLALRTQQVIAHESGLDAVVDPLGGSYLVENLTDRIEEASRKLIGEIEEEGGVLAAIESGFIQGEIRRSAYEYQRMIESGEAIIVGLNAFTEEEAPPAIYRPDPAVEEAQRRRLRDMKASRDSSGIEDLLNSLKETAAGGDNLMPALIATFASNASIGEVTSALKSVFGEY